MNPYERHIIHTAISAIEGVRSESKGEGNDRRVVIYSTDPDASNLPDRESAGAAAAAPAVTAAAPRRDDRRGRGNGRGNGRREGGRGPRGYGKGPRPSSVPAREFADAPRDPEAKPQAPATTHRIHDDGDDFGHVRQDRAVIKAILQTKPAAPRGLPVFVWFVCLFAAHRRWPQGRVPDPPAGVCGGAGCGGMRASRPTAARMVEAILFGWVFATVCRGGACPSRKPCDAAGSPGRYGIGPYRGVR